MFRLILRLIFFPLMLISAALFFIRVQPYDGGPSFIASQTHFTRLNDAKHQIAIACSRRREG